MIINLLEIKNAKFEVLDEDNNVVDTLITNEDGKAKSKQLLKGKYKVREIESGSPFYLVNSDIFEVEIVNHGETENVVVEEESVD